MPAWIGFGFLKSDNITQGGSICFGLNIVQNRNSTKQNNGMYMIGDGIKVLPVGVLANVDPDYSDTISTDFQNYAGPQY